MTEYLAFHNDPALAELVRGQVAAHAAADEIAQGVYWQNGKGCFIGCIAHSSDPARVEELTGFPVMLTKLAESIFEGLPPMPPPMPPMPPPVPPASGRPINLLNC